MGFGFRGLGFRDEGVKVWGRFRGWGLGMRFGN